MTIQLIQQYYSNVDKLIRYGGTRNEMSLRKAFQELLDHYARSKNLVLVPEVGVMGKRGRTVHPDGTLKDALRQDWGYWESKDEKDTLDDEIRTKFAKGYPEFNILFEDTHTAVLIQGGNEILRADLADARAIARFDKPTSCFNLRTSRILRKDTLSWVKVPVRVSPASSL